MEPDLVNKLTELFTRLDTVVSFVVGLLIALGISRFINRQPKESTAPAQRIFRVLLESNVPEQMAKILVAQAAHETGNFTSNLFKTANNAFGMKVPNIRPTFTIGETKSGFAKFATIEDSASDLLLWLEHFGIPLNFVDPREYVKAIKARGYFEDSIGNYTNGVLRAFMKGMPGISTGFAT